jgi:probable lipoprotein NlpC
VKKNSGNLGDPPKLLYFLGFLLFPSFAFAVVPIQGNSLRGGAAAEARLKLIYAAESYLGTQYRYGGLDRKGLDCSGLVYLSFNEALGIKVPRTAESLYTWTERIDTAELQPGDLVFFVTTGPGVSHLGIYAGAGRFIHSASEGPVTGVMYSGLDEAYWKRTYKGGGRALPWDDDTAQVMSVRMAEKASGVNHDTRPSLSAAAWADSGFYTGFGAGWTWGGFFEGAPSPFRGISVLGAAGYKWSNFRAGMELRPEWDGALGVFRLPFTLTFGTDLFQVFGGPAYTFGEPSLDLGSGERHYKGGAAWLWEAGLSTAFPPIRISSGALSLYGELAWQPSHWEDNEDFSFKPDLTAALRFSTGLRYLWRWE